MTAKTFEDLCAAAGILPSFIHAGGHRVDIPDSTRSSLLAAQGFNTESEAGMRAELERIGERRWRRLLPPVSVIYEDEGRPSVPVVVPLDDGDLRVTLVTEQGRSETWTTTTEGPPEPETRTIDGRTMTARRLVLPALLPLGYHRLSVTATNGTTRGQSLLIHAPRRCWQPDLLNREGRTWGFSVQLYGVRSKTNWGHGDFTDLAKLVEISARLGAGFVGINPLHALFPERPDRCSPYSPNSRGFLHPLYLDVAAVPDLVESREVPQAIASTGLHGRIEALRRAARVDYQGVADAKRPVLEKLWKTFRRNHLERGSPRAQAFQRFVTEGGETLRRFALFEALRDVMAYSGPGRIWLPWQHWPEEYHRPGSPSVAEFAEEHAERIDFHLYLQWEADRQLAQAGMRAGRDLGLGLYRDVAVGFDRDGADCWIHQDLVPNGVSVGCPPDLRNPIGQDWGVLPFAPDSLHEAGYVPFIEMVRSNMRHAGVLRIDHAFQLTRLYWVPLDCGPREGGYVRYPQDDLLAIIALESHRNRCAVVAEDLGTIPEGFRERLIATGCLSFRVLHRERDADRSYKAPDAYPAVSTVAAGTHDQATLSGFWTGRDVELRTELGLYPDRGAALAAGESRQVDKEKLVAALRRHADLEGDPETPEGLPTDALALAVHRFLARTPSRMMIVQPEDLTDETEQVNMPSTVDEHPNWQRRYRFTVEDLPDQPLISQLAEMLAEEGR